MNAPLDPAAGVVAAAGQAVPSCADLAGLDDQHYPACAMQQDLWLAEQRTENMALYNRAALLHLHGNLDIQVLEQALAVLLHKHPVLRTVLDFDLSARALQGRLRCFQPVFLQPETVDERRLAELASQAAAQPFILRERMYRFRLWRLSRDHHALLLCCHHALTDGWSVAVMLQSLAEAYNRLRVDPAWQAREIDTEFLHYCRQQWRHGLNYDCASELAWWQQHLQTLAPRKMLLRVTPAPAAARSPFSVKTLQTALPPELLAGARAFCRSQHLTLFSCVLGALKLALAQHSGEVEQTVGVPVTARSSLAQEHSVGCYVNILLTRDVLEPATGPAAWVQQVKQVHAHVQQALLHVLPLQVLGNALRPAPKPSGNVWFDVLLAFQNLPAPAVKLHGLRVEVEAVESLYGQYPLKLEVLPAEPHWILRFEYAETRFAEKDVEALALTMQRHLGAMMRQQ